MSRITVVVVTTVAGEVCLMVGQADQVTGGKLQLPPAHPPRLVEGVISPTEHRATSGGDVWRQSWYTPKPYCVKTECWQALGRVEVALDGIEVCSPVSWAGGAMSDQLSAGFVRLRSG